MKLLHLLLPTIFCLTACNHQPVTINKSLAADETTQSQKTYATAETLNAAAMWSEDLPLGGLVKSLFAKSDSIALTTDVFQPKDRKNRPAIIYIHGGAFVHGATGVADPTATLVGTEFAQRGYRVFSIEYRSMNLFAPSFIKAGYTAAQDGKAAIRYIYNHHRELNVDPDNIFLIGYSAGGITALNTAYLDPGEEVLGREEKLERLYGPLLSVGEPGNTEPTLAGVISIAGGVLDMAVFDASPTPLCLIHGEEDEIIDPNCQLPFAKAANLLSTGVTLLSASFDSEVVRRRILDAKLDEICGGAAIFDFTTDENMNVAYHPVAGGGHFLLLDPRGKPTEHTEYVLRVVAEFAYANLN